VKAVEILLAENNIRDTELVMETPTSASALD
jgi:hypothetical protein